MATGSKRMDFSRFPRKFVPKHEALFFEDDDSRTLYVLLTGSLGVYRDEVQVATVDDPLSVVGEMSALTGRPRNATVRALEPTTLVMIDDPDALFTEYPQLGAKLARLLATRLAAMTRRFVDLKTLLSQRRAAGPASDGVSVQARMEADTLPPGVLPPETVPVAVAAAAAAGATVPVPLAAPADPETAEPRQIDEVIGALSDLLDWDPSMSALT